MCGHPVFQDCPQCFRFFFAVFAVFVVFVFVTTDYLLGTTITDHYAHWVDYSLFYFLLISGIPLSFETGIFVKIQVLRTNRGISLESFPDFLAFPLSIERGPPFPSWCRPQKMDLSPYITPRPVPRLFTLHNTNILCDGFVFSLSLFRLKLSPCVIPRVDRVPIWLPAASGLGNQTTPVLLCTPRTY